MGTGRVSLRHARHKFEALLARSASWNTVDTVLVANMSAIRPR
jgi:hypothetical protein